MRSVPTPAIVSCSQTATQRQDSSTRIDSIIIREYIRGDTVYRDRWHERCSERLLLCTDTVYQTREVVVHTPPERYIPPPVKCLAWIGALALFLLFLRLLFLLLKYLR